MSFSAHVDVPSAHTHAQMSFYCYDNYIVTNSVYVRTSMSASVFSPTSRSSWRSHHLGPGGQLFDPSQSYAYTYSAGGFSALDASTFSMQPLPQVKVSN